MKIEATADAADDGVLSQGLRRRAPQDPSPSVRVWFAREGLSLWP